MHHPSIFNALNIMYVFSMINFFVRSNEKMHSFQEIKLFQTEEKTYSKFYASQRPSKRRITLFLRVIEQHLQLKKSFSQNTVIIQRQLRSQFEKILNILRKINILIILCKYYYFSYDELLKLKQLAHNIESRGMYYRVHWICITIITFGS